MFKANAHFKDVVDKLKSLPPERQKEVADFIDFLSQYRSDHGSAKAARSISEPVFKKIWNNPEDAVYDDL